MWRRTRRLYNYNPTFGVSKYIAHAGGRTRTARDLDEVQLIDTDGQTHPFRPGMKPAPGLVLSGIAATLAATR